MSRRFLRSLLALACTIAFAAATSQAQMPTGGGRLNDNMPAETKAPPQSPPATATVSLNGKTITINYGAPSMRGRKIMGELVPYDKVWRTGANPATTFVTQGNLRIGSATVPAGSYTLYTLPSAGQWMLIINKQTGQWGTEYHQEQDLVRVPMKGATLPSPQEKMSITFENTRGNSTDLHIRWENTDQSVRITAE